MEKSGGGRSRKLSLNDMGFAVNKNCMVCGKCGYGQNEPWVPIIKSALCPKCGNNAGHRQREFPLSVRAEELMGSIKELESRAGIDFIEPHVLRETYNELRKLKRELGTELRRCEKASFAKLVAN